VSQANSGREHELSAQAAGGIGEGVGDFLGESTEDTAMVGGFPALPELYNQVHGSTKSKSLAKWEVL
jgi:hypothetical protein